MWEEVLDRHALREERELMAIVFHVMKQATAGWVLPCSCWWLHRLCLSSSRRYRRPRRCRTLPWPSMPLFSRHFEYLRAPMITIIPTESLTSTIGSQYLVSCSLISNSRRQLGRGSLRAHHISWPGRKIYRWDDYNYKLNWTSWRWRTEVGYSLTVTCTCKDWERRWRRLFLLETVILFLLGSWLFV